MRMGARIFACMQRLLVMTLWVGLGIAGPAPLSVQPSEIVIPKDADKAASNFRICNASAAPVQLDLRTTEFIIIPGVTKTAALAVVAPAGMWAKGGSLAPKACLTVSLTLADLAQVAFASANLVNGDQVLEQIFLRRERPGYALATDGIPADKPEVRLFRPASQQKSRMFIRNADPWPYMVSVKLDLDTYDCDTNPPNSPLVIPPNGSQLITLSCPSDLFTFFRTGFLKSETRIAHAAIGVIIPGTDIVIANKRAPVTAILSYHADSRQPLANGLWSLGLLVLGALFSVFVTIILPSNSRKKELARRLVPIDKDLKHASLLANVGTPNSHRFLFDTPEHHKVKLLLNLEQKRLTELVNSVWLVSMNSGTVLAEVQAKTELLEKKTALFRRVAVASASSVDPNVGHMPLSVLERVNMNCRAGSVLLERETLTPEEWARLEGLVAESEELLSDPGRQLDWLETRTLTVERAVQEILCDPGPPKALRNPTPEPWSNLCSHSLGVVAEMDRAPFFPGQYAARDRRAIFFTYVRRYAALEDVSPEISGDPGWTRLKEEFTSGCLKRNDLLRLKGLIEQLEQGASREALVREIEGQRVDISPSKAEAPAFSPMRFQIVFRDAPHFNSASARCQIEVKWNFGTTGSCNGWEVWHYFPKSKTSYPVTATFLDGGRKVGEILTTVTASQNAMHLTNQSKLMDVFRFSLTVLTATFALTGVRQVLPNADALGATLGALALGFSADAFKNLLAARK